MKTILTLVIGFLVCSVHVEAQDAQKLAPKDAFDDPFVPETAPPLNQDWLRKVKDRGPLPSVPLIKDPADYPANFKVYAEAIINAFETPLDAFKKSAKQNEDLQFAHLYSRPRENRGKVVKITGHLKMLRKWRAPDYVRNKTLLQDIYEGWIYGETRGTNPYCVQFVTKPDSVKLGEKIDHYVEFYGYFLKLYRYVDQKRNTQDTPLLIGPTVVVTQAPNPPPPSEGTTLFSAEILIAIVAFTAAVAAVVGVMSFFYRRADRRVREQIEKTKAARAIEMIEQGAETSVAEDPNSKDGVWDDEQQTDENSDVGPEKRDQNEAN